jgi:16S rRNA (guanine966-N2)-methyltransferase
VPDAGRVIAGTARSIRLDAPGPGTRPLADRVKQTLFAILEPDLAGARFLDLFAGSGAAEAVFVEHDRTAVQVIHANLDRTDLAATGRATVVRNDAIKWLKDPERAQEPPIDIALVDPPYDDRKALTKALEALGPLLSEHARVVAKHFWRDAPPPQVGLLASDRQRRFGETALTFYRRQESAAGPGDITEDA